MNNRCLLVIICTIVMFSTYSWLDAGTIGADNPTTWCSSELANVYVDQDGREVVRIAVPGRPPQIPAASVTILERYIAGVANSISAVPAYNWSYGCSPTSAAMLFGYYDRSGYSNIYTGPTNDGVSPMDNTAWGPGIGGSYGECPLSATHDGIDGRITRGHVDDYWIEYDNCSNDPYITQGWGEHTGDCTGDFMGTNQSKYDNCDGATSFWYDTKGNRLYDYTLPEALGLRDGCHGMRLFMESRGYSVITNCTQLIRGQGTNPNLGFTFADYTAEIDSGRPVLIQVEGHTMLGFGYDSSGNIVYLHDTWDYSDHQMTWGGTYSGLQQWGVTIIQLSPSSSPTVTTNAASAVTTNSATLNGNLTGLGTASSVAVAFEWGTTIAYGNETEPQTLTSAEPFNASIIDLSPGIMYHYRSKALGDGISYGDDMSFTTLSSTIQISLIAGWNMVSVPTVPPDNSVTSIFPGADAVFTWNPLTASYIIPTTIEPERGYWVAVVADTIINVTGVPVTTWTSDIKAGWNMIGSVIDNASIADPNDNPDNSIQLPAWWWDPVSRTYVMTTDIEPGKGYWVASIGNCTLMMP